MGKINKFVVVYCLMFCSIGVLVLEPIDAFAASNKQAYSAYADAISYGTIALTSQYSNAEYGLIDLNGDGVKELVILNFCDLYVWTYKKGKVSKFFSYNGSDPIVWIYFDKKEKTYCNMANKRK